MATSPRYRMFIDEVGHAGSGQFLHENDRFLSLTRLIFEQQEIPNNLIPVIESIKDRYFGRNQNGAPVILHRKEIVQRKPPFDALTNQIVAVGFDRDLLHIISNLEFRAVTVVLDKKEYVERYTTWRHHPYNYCVEILAERLVLFLEERDATGDLMAEARGKNDDNYLRHAVGHVLRNGNAYVERKRFVSRILPNEPKIHKKNDNIAGLQLADLIAHPSFLATKYRKQRKSLPDNFGGRIAEILEASKYRRAPDGRVDGFGRKWIP